MVNHIYPLGCVLPLPWFNSRLALNNLHPDLYSNDIFLRFGSQDKYTLFSPLYGFFIKLLGIEPAAALLTFISQISLFSAIWLLARQFMSAGLATFALALVITVPGFYGSDYTFYFLETFLTPRTLAEALVLFALTAQLRKHYLLTGILLLFSLVTHPLIALAGLAMALSPIYFRFWKWLTALALIVLTIIIGTVKFSSLGALVQFDPHWLELVKTRIPYLFTALWSMDDWAPSVVPLVSLAICLKLFSESSQKNFIACALFIGCCGLTLNLIGCDWLHIVLVTQSQPWRWLWLSTLVAILFLPKLIFILTKVDYPGRSATLLLVAAWLSRDYIGGIVLAVLAFIVLAAPKNWGSPSYWRLIFRFSLAMLAIPVIRILAVSQFDSSGITQFVQMPEYFKIFKWLDIDRAVPCRAVPCRAVPCRAVPLFILSTLLIIATKEKRLVALVFYSGLAFLSGLASIYSYSHWTNFLISQQTIDNYKDWRDMIPEGEDIFWIDESTGNWILLQRPNYISKVQTAGMLFSREAAFEMERRAKSLDSITPGKYLLDWDMHQEKAKILPTLSAFCAQQKEFGGPRFIITSAKLDIEPIALRLGPALSGYNGSRLYDCDSTQ